MTALVLVVDDDDAVRDSLCALLEVSGYRTRAYADAAAFRAREGVEDAACVFLDVRLPDGNGLEIARALRASSPALPVIVMTGHGDVAMAVEAMREGATDFIEKPFEEARMATALNRALSAASPAVADDALAERFARLTPRETEVMQGMVDGKPTKVIARDLDLSPRTVEIHRGRVMRKLEAGNLADVVKMAIRARIVR